MSESGFDTPEPTDWSALAPPSKCVWCGGTGNAWQASVDFLNYWPCSWCGGTGKGPRWKHARPLDITSDPW